MGLVQERETHVHKEDLPQRDVLPVVIFRHPRYFRHQWRGVWGNVPKRSEVLERGLQQMLVQEREAQVHKEGLHHGISQKKIWADIKTWADIKAWRCSFNTSETARTCVTGRPTIKQVL